MIQNEKGITLVALIITIIILIILAGVSITAVFGEDGIISNATEARFKTEVGQIKEIIDVEIVKSYVTKERQNVVLEYVDIPSQYTKKYIGTENKYLIISEANKLAYNEPNEFTEKQIKWLNDLDIWGPTGNPQKPDNPTDELEGLGTEEEPFIINCIEDLILFSGNVYYGYDNYKNKYVILGRSLDFNDNSSYRTEYLTPTTRESIKALFMPIGRELLQTEIQYILDIMEAANGLEDRTSTKEEVRNMRLIDRVELGIPREIEKLYEQGVSEEGLIEYYFKYNFLGTFLGNGNYIKNANVEGGFFTIVTPFTTITDFGVIDIKVRSTDPKYAVSMGSIAMVNFGGTIQNCYATGEISATNAINHMVGGIVGSNIPIMEIHGTVQNVVNKTNIKGNIRAGSSTMIGNILGGVIGMNLSDMTIENCHNYGNIVFSYSSGGIIGTNHARNTIRQCSNQGSIASLYSAGGIVGMNMFLYNTIEECFNRGSFYALIAGGISSYNTADVIIQNCYNNGSNQIPIENLITVMDFMSIYLNITEEELANMSETERKEIEETIKKINNGEAFEELQLALDLFFGGFLKGGIVSMSYGRIENCYNAASMKGSFVGGISSGNYNTGIIQISNLIRNLETNRILQNCYNIGNITSEIGTASGICAINYGRLQTCYNTGRIQSVNPSSGIAMGNDGTVLGCVYKTGTSEIGVRGQLDATGVAESKPEEQMPELIDVINKDSVFVEDANNINGKNPVLAWEHSGYLATIVGQEVYLQYFR